MNPGDTIYIIFAGEVKEMVFQGIATTSSGVRITRISTPSRKTIVYRSTIFATKAEALKKLFHLKLYVGGR